MRSFELLLAQRLFVYNTLIGIDLDANAMELRDEERNSRSKSRG